MTSETPNTPATNAAHPIPPAEAALPPSTSPDIPALPPPSARFPAKPGQLPEPTYWPFFMGLGIAFIGWGLISFWLVSIGGLIVFAIALRGWINNLRHEK
jgi:hypothetical protein